ncbi:MAG: ester cyclase [Dehalococcoidia bacterium]|nr:ester cyclase [Dehalococcoidia bacterium]
MSIETNKAVIRRFTEEVWRGRNYSAIDEIFPDDYRDPEIPAPARENLKKFFQQYFASRPDFEVLGEDLTAEDDRVVQYIRGAFTNHDERRGPVGKRMLMHEINIFTIADGKIVGRFGIGRSVPED